MSNLNYERIIENLTKKTVIQQQKLVKLFGNFTIQQQMEIMNTKYSLFHKLKTKNKELEENSIFALSAFIIAIDEFLIKLNETEKNLLKFEQKKYKSNLKKQRLLQYWSIVKELKENKSMSFREISSYLKKFYKADFSYSTIYQKWQEIERNK